MDTNDQNNPKTELQRKQQAIREYSNPDPKDDKELLDRIKDKVRIHEPEMREIRDFSEQNEERYYSRYQDPKKLRKGEDNIMLTRAFTNWETLIPIITRTTPEPNITVVQREIKKTIIKSLMDMIMLPKKKTRARLQDLLPYYLKDKWYLSKVDGGANMQPKMEENFRNNATQRVMIFKCRWHDKYKVLEPVVVNVNDCIFAKDTEDDSELEFFGHYCSYTLGELKKMGIAQEKIDELEKLMKNKKEKISDTSIVKLMEYWEPEQVVLEYEEKLILKQFANPLYNWKDKSFNHFSTPMIPVMIETDMKQNSGLIGNSSFLEVGRSLLENADKRKRQFNRNAKLANGMYIVDGNSNISKQDSRNLSSDTDKTLFMEKGATIPASQAVQVITGRPMDQSIYNDMLHSLSEYDKLSGVNETVRGERTASETKGGRQILKESALSRNEVLFRVNERIAQKFFNWTIQAMYVHCEDNGFAVYSSGADIDKSGVITKDMLKGVKILCYVKDGSTVPVDKSSKYADADDMFKNNMISRKHALMLRDIPNYEEVAREKYLEDTDPARLYDKKITDSKYDARAKMDLYELIKGDVEPPIVNFKDIELADRYLKTMGDYMDNDDIDNGNLPEYDQLDTEIQVRIADHYDKSAKKIAELVAKGVLKEPAPEQPPMGMQPQMPMGQAPSPMMGAQVPPQMGLPPMAPQQQVPMQDPTMMQG